MQYRFATTAKELVGPTRGRAAHKALRALSPDSNTIPMKGVGTPADVMTVSFFLAADAAANGPGQAVALDAGPT
jgi:hypothetical protein